MAITRAQFAAYLEPDLLDANVAAFKDAPSVGEKHVKVRKTRKSREYTQTAEPLGYAGYVPEGGEVPYDSPVLGYQKQYVPLKYGLGVKITEEMLEDNLYEAAFTKLRDLGRASRNTLELQFADLLNSGFSTVLGGDGIAAFSASHTLEGGGVATYTTTASNTAFSGTSLFAALLVIQGHKTGKGHPLNLGYGRFLVVIPKELMKTAWELKNTTRGQPGTANITANIFNSGMTWDYIVDPFLTSTTAWFVLTPEHDFTCFMRRQPTVSRDGDWNTGSIKYKVTYRAAFGLNECRGIYGNAGA